MFRHKCRGIATFAIWKTTCRAWRTTFDLILINFSHAASATSSAVLTKATPPAAERHRRQRTGRTLDVLNIVLRLAEVGTAGPAVRAPSGRNLPAALPPVTPRRGVPTNEFKTSDVYAFTRELEKLHPNNSDTQHREQAATFATRFVSNCK